MPRCRRIGGPPKAIEAVRKVILKNLDKNYEEGMLYGAIGYYVPHKVYPHPRGYHCDPKTPLPPPGVRGWGRRRITCRLG